MIYIREQLEKLEEATLMRYALRSSDSRGRVYSEAEDDYRTCFQKDRDRIIHSRSFRRLQAKTQVFVAGHGDHYRNRMTHSLEVSQVSRDTARTLGLNQDLVEAIALAHDLGHTPFGHAGEEALDQIMREFGLHYEHNEQSKRIVDDLESVYPTFPGLNLTHEVREGMLKHKSSWDNIDKEFTYLSLEAQIVNLADEIAYQTHDVDDGLRANIFAVEEIKQLSLWQKAYEKTVLIYGNSLSDRMLSIRIVSALLGILIEDVIQETSKRLEVNKIETLDQIKQFPDVLVCFSPEIAHENSELKEFLFSNFYMHPQVLEHSQNGQKIINEVFWRYYENPADLPEKLKQRISSGEKKEIIIKDYVAGMTDNFAKQICSKFAQQYN